MRRTPSLKIYVYELPEALMVQPTSGQYALGAFMTERAMVDKRRVMNIEDANLFLVPMDFFRFRQESQNLPYPENEKFVCDKVEALKKIVKGDAKKHVVPVARVSSAMYFEFGKSCSAFKWLKSMQWVTIEAPWTLDVDSNAHVAGEGSQHTVPYPSGLRFRNKRDAELLREYQATRKRNYLVAQTLGGHSRTDSKLRDVLKEECSRRPSQCVSDWQAERKTAPRRDGIEESSNFEGHLAHFVQHLPLYARATFCIQPFGTTPTRGALYHCLLAGGIPVIFEPFFFEALPNLFKGEWAIHLDQTKTLDDVSSVYSHLEKIPRYQIAQMQKVIADAGPRLQYSLPDAYDDDAYEYAIQRAYAYSRS